MISEFNPKEKKNRVFLKSLWYIIFFFIIILGLVSEFLSEFIFKNIYAFSAYEKQFFGEAFAVVVMVVIIFITKKGYIFKNKQTRILKSFKVGWYILVYSAVVLLSTIILMRGKEINIYSLFGLILACISIGFFEEILLRGLVMNKLLEKYGKTYKGVIISIVASSVMFGLIHLFNLSSSSLYPVIVQTIGAISIGIYFGAVYYKTRNIYAVSFLHAIYDVAALFINLYLVNCATSAGGSYNITSLLLAFLFLIPAAFMLRKDKINESLEEKMVLPSDYKTKNRVLKIIMIIILIFGTIYLGYDYLVNNKNLLKDNNCLVYKTGKIKNYVIQYYKLKNYNLEMNSGDISFNIKINDDSKVEITNLKTIQKVILDIDDAEVFAVFKNNNYYEFLILTAKGDVAYRSVYLNEGTVNNSAKFLKDLKKSFEKVNIGNVSEIGYVKLLSNDKKYPIFNTYYFDMYIIHSNGVVYKYWYLNC